LIWHTKIFWRKNEKCQKRRPKPTHHLLIPFADDMEKLEKNVEKNNNNQNKKIEQEMLREFMEQYLDDVEKIESVDKSDKILFLRDTFVEILNCFVKSKDSDLNWDLFCDRGEKVIFFKKSITL